MYQDLELVEHLVMDLQWAWKRSTIYESPEELNPLQTSAPPNYPQEVQVFFYLLLQCNHPLPMKFVHISSASASAGGADRDLAGKQFPRKLRTNNNVEEFNLS